jgi:hypothetical protein
VPDDYSKSVKKIKKNNVNEIAEEVTERISHLKIEHQPPNLVQKTLHPFQTSFNSTSQQNAEFEKILGK